MRCARYARRAARFFFFVTGGRAFSGDGRGAGGRVSTVAPKLAGIVTADAQLPARCRTAHRRPSHKSCSARSPRKYTIRAGTCERARQRFHSSRECLSASARVCSVLLRTCYRHRHTPLRPPDISGLAATYGRPKRRRVWCNSLCRSRQTGDGRAMPCAAPQ